MQEKKAISLIVLVITIIVMIILAGTMIAVLTGENSIIAQAKSAKEKNDMAQLKESAELIRSELMSDYYTGNADKYDQATLLNKISENFEGSSIEDNRVIVENGLYDIVVDDKLNITVDKSEGSTKIKLTAMVSGTSTTATTVTLKINVPGTISMYDFMLEYTLPNKSTTELEKIVIDILNSDNSTDETKEPITTMPDDLKLQIKEYGKVLGATTYEQSLRFFVQLVRVESANTEFAASVLQMSTYYPMAVQAMDLKVYTDEANLENQLLSVADFDGTIDELIANEYDGATKDEVKENLSTIEGIEYTEALQYYITSIIMDSMSDDEMTELEEKYNVHIQISNGQSIDTVYLIGGTSVEVGLNGTYTFEAETADGRKATTSITVGDSDAISNPYGPNDWEYAWTYKNGVKSEMLTGGGAISGDITVKFYKLNNTITLPEDVINAWLGTELEIKVTTANEYAMVVECTGNMDDIESDWQTYGILSTYEGVRFPLFVTKAIFCDGVTNVSGDACFGFVSLNEVKVSKDFSKVGLNSFAGCSSLTNIDNILEKITYIETNTFGGCTSLKEITIPSNVEVVTGFNSSGLEKVTISSGTTKLDDSAFNDCVSLKTVTLPNTLEIIEGGPDSGAFQNCSALEEIIIPSSVTSIGEYAFASCTSLRSAKIYGNITEILSGTFQKCSSLVDLTIPNSVQTIGTHAFAFCSSLETLVLPSSMTTLGNSFQHCTSLKNITFPAGLTAIDSYTFRSNTSLTEVTLPSELVSIGEMVFVDCSGLKTININSNKVTSIGSEAFSTIADNSTITVLTQGVKDLFIDGTNYDASKTTIVVK